MISRANPVRLVGWKVSPGRHEGSELHRSGAGGASEPGDGAFLEAEPGAVGGADGEEGNGIAHPRFVADARHMLPFQ